MEEVGGCNQNSCSRCNPLRAWRAKPRFTVGYAVADSPMGPFRKAPENPILRRPADFVGAGHHSFFTDKEGRLRIVFHVHYSKTQIHPRRVIIGSVFFEDGKLKIGQDFIQPIVVK